jgi:hypothetical protein
VFTNRRDKAKEKNTQRGSKDRKQRSKEAGSRAGKHMTEEQKK